MSCRKEKQKERCQLEKRLSLALPHGPVPGNQRSCNVAWMHVCMHACKHASKEMGWHHWPWKLKKIMECYEGQKKTLDCILVGVSMRIFTRCFTTIWAWVEVVLEVEVKDDNRDVDVSDVSDVRVNVLNVDVKVRVVTLAVDLTLDEGCFDDDAAVTAVVVAGLVEVTVVDALKVWSCCKRRNNANFVRTWSLAELASKCSQHWQESLVIRQ